jgi:ATP-dependent DNA helicase RecQ
MDAEERQTAQDEWMQGNVQVMVATKAFGLGIDKPNIWRVIRNGVPENISAWVQESGQAGRDGNPATATIFYDEGDTDHAAAWIN